MCFIKDNAFFCSCPRGYYGVLCEHNSELNMLLKIKIQVIQQEKIIIFCHADARLKYLSYEESPNKNSPLACWIIGIIINKSKLF